MPQTDSSEFQAAPADSHWRLALLPALPLVIAVMLAAMGRVWWCEAGDGWPWSWNVWSRHNSQHLIDPYTLSHLEHGIGLFMLLNLLCPRCWTPWGKASVVSAVEATWEVVENTDWMIQRYRAATISLDYFGDSILNSVSDFGACLAGIAVAQRLPLRVTGGLLVLLELVSVIWIRDSLLLNILMLAFPQDVVREWQMGAAPR